MNHLIKRVSKSTWTNSVLPLSAPFFVLLLLTLHPNPITGEINITQILPPAQDQDQPVENSTLPIPVSNHTRDSRQLMSLLKNLLRQPQSPPTPQTPGISYQQQSIQPQYQPQYQNQYPLQNPTFNNDYGGTHHPPSSAVIPSSIHQKIHSANTYPNFNLNHPSQNQDYYNQQESQLFPQTLSTPGGGISGSGSNSNSNLLSLLTSVLGGGTNNAMASNMLSKLGLGNPEDLDLFSLLNFGSIEGMLGRVNRFDKLQCIPRMICQMVAKRNEDARIRLTSTTTSTTTTTTQRPEKKSKSKGNKKSKTRSGRFFKIDGVDTALDQFVKFLDLMQLKDWSLYPYVKGMTEGHTVTHPGDCAHRFSSCPFSEDQLVYYFNNYNGGFFQSFRSGRMSDIKSSSNGTISA